MTTGLEDILTPEVCASVRADIASARTLPRRAFTDEGYYDVEMQQVFHRNWSALCLHDAIPHKAVRSFEFAGLPLLVTRDDAGVLRVFHNIVPYDGCLAVMADADPVDEIVTPYHGWRYGLDGKLHATPYWAGSVPGTPPAEPGSHPTALAEVASTTWGPVLFVDVSGTAGPADDALAPLHREFAWMALDQMAASCDSNGARIESPEALKSNWKTHAENWGINVLHEAFVHGLYASSPEVPRMTPEGSLTFDEVIDGRLLSLKFAPESFEQTYGPMPFPDFATGPAAGYFGSFLPNLHFGVFPNLVHLIVSSPDAPDRTRTEHAQYYHASVASRADDADLREALAAGFAEAGEEDGRIVEAVQAARRSPAFEQQYYSPLWDHMHHAFSRWLLDQMLKK